MRKLIALLLVVAAGYYLYTHQEVWRKYNPFASTTAPDNTGMKQSFAWKMFSRKGYDPYKIEILLIEGNRWRIEVKKRGSSKIAVAVSDGSRTAASPPTGSAGALDPRPTVNGILADAAKTSDAAQSKSPEVTEERDGHTCWKTNVTYQGLAGQFWVDSSTGFPVCFDGTMNGAHVDLHISPLQVDFAQSGAEFFDADHTEPLFGKDLDDDAIEAQIALFSHGPGPADSTQASAMSVAKPAAQNHYILKDPVSIKTSYGTMTIPAKTEVRILSQTGNVYRVAGGGEEFEVQGEQVLSVPQ